MNFSSFTILFLLSLQSFSESWITTKLSWPKYDKYGQSRIKPSNQDIDKVLEIIQLTDFKKIIINKIKIKSMIYVCKSEEKSPAGTVRGSLIANEEDFRHMRVKDFSFNSIKLNKSQTIYKDFFGLTRKNNTFIETTESRSIISILETSFNPIICLSPELNIYEAASTLVHELSHLRGYRPIQHQKDLKQHLFDFDKFSKKYIEMKGGEASAFADQCTFENSLSLIFHKFQPRSLCQDYQELLSKGDLKAFNKKILENYELASHENHYYLVKHVTSYLRKMKYFITSRSKYYEESYIPYLKSYGSEEELQYFQRMQLSLSKDLDQINRQLSKHETLLLKLKNDRSLLRNQNRHFHDH